MEISVQQAGNGKSTVEDPKIDTPDQPVDGYLVSILQSLQTMKNGDFSVRLPVHGPDFRAKSPTTSTRL
jgi:hypothetical protein